MPMSDGVRRRARTRGRPGPYRVVSLDRDLVDEGLADWWNALPQPQASPVLRWEYLRAWADAFVPPGGRLAVHLALAGDDPVAAVALYRRGGVLHALANDHSDHFDAVWDPAHPGAVSALAAALLRRRTDLIRLPGGSELLAAIRHAAPPVLADQDTSPYVQLPGSPDDLLASLSSRFRANVRKAIRTLEGLGEVQFTDVAAGTPEGDAAFAAMRDVEAHSWKGRQGDAIDSHEETRRFYRALALEGPASQWTHLAVLRAGDRVVAAQMDLEHAGRRFGLRTSFVDDLPGKQSPGLVLLWSVLSDEIGRGLRVHDFGGGQDAWKLHWTDAGAVRVSLRTWPATPAGRLTFATRERLKPVVKPLLRRITNGG
jgi:CelD/BcsL family acetyltransferase involved in cellulose biosynthesis